jgi:hypothetical protein
VFVVCILVVLLFSPEELEENARSRKIYACNGAKTEAFDPVAGKWQTVSSQDTSMYFGEGQMSYMKSYENLLWVFNESGDFRAMDPYYKLSEPVWSFDYEYSLHRAVNDYFVFNNSEPDSDEENNLGEVRDIVVFKAV